MNGATAILVLAALAVVAAGALLVWAWVKKRAFNTASSLAQEVFPVWAGQGPFASGSESAAAMRYAFKAVFGPKGAEKYIKETFKHAEAYDKDPATWEKVRRETPSNARTDEYLVVAKEWAEAGDLVDALNTLIERPLRSIRAPRTD